ncbi:MAG: GNAT family N-acetyltransferase [Actinomycetota bacterium]
MSIPQGYVVRRPHRTDVDAITKLLIACDREDIGHPDSDEEDVLWRWRTPEFSLDDDAWLISSDADGIVAYCWVFEATIEASVHPRHRASGLGRHLHDLAERRAVQQAPDEGSLALSRTVSARDAAARRLLEESGYEQSHHYARMTIAFEEPPRAPSWPQGVTVRTYELGRDDRRVHDVINAAWAEYAVNAWQPEPFERWMERTAGEDFDPELWFVGDTENGVAGASLCLKRPSMGWVGHLGVHPVWRGRGVGRALLEHSFGEYYRRGVKEVGLTVSSRNSPSARRLYERVGMREVLRYESWTKTVTSRRRLDGASSP